MVIASKELAALISIFSGFHDTFKARTFTDGTKASRIHDLHYNRKTEGVNGFL